MPWDQFLGNRRNKPQSPNDVASRPLPKSPVGSSLDGVVPQMIIRSPRVRPGNFLFSDAKRLLQQYPGKTGSDSDIAKLTRLTHQRHWRSNCCDAQHSPRANDVVVELVI